MKYYNFIPKVSLKSCPFCGSDANLHFRRECFGHGDYEDLVWVECSGCHACSNSESYYAGGLTQDHVDIVVDSWNRRFVE